MEFIFRSVQLGDGIQFGFQVFAYGIYESDGILARPRGASVDNNCVSEVNGLGNVFGCNQLGQCSTNKNIYFLNNPTVAATKAKANRTPPAITPADKAELSIIIPANPKIEARPLNPNSAPPVRITPPCFHIEEA